MVISNMHATSKWIKYLGHQVFAAPVIPSNLN